MEIEEQVLLVKAVGAVGLSLLALTGFLLLTKPSLFGFTALAETMAEKQGHAASENKMQEAAEGKTSQEQSAEKTFAVSSISFNVVNKTTLEANASILAIAPCPKTTTATILVKNTGASDAERIFLEPSHGLQIQKCLGCGTKAIKPNGQVALSLELCKKNPLPQSMKISSLNADSVEIKTG